MLKSHQVSVKAMHIGLNLRSQKHGNICWKTIPLFFSPTSRSKQDCHRH